ncbi:MAG TPA: hypothetical protein PKD85_00625 [Saprospiraceae bacterium]|nr:hypothetical protein [Saprospiraceae bacterium]
MEYKHFTNLIYISLCVLGLLLMFNIFSGYLLIQSIDNKDSQAEAIVIGYFAVEKYCSFNRWVGGAYVKFFYGNNTCVAPMIFDDTCGNIKNETIDLVRKLHPLNSAISGNYDKCNLHSSKGVIWVRAVLFIFTLILTFVVLSFTIILYKRRRAMYNDDLFEDLERGL